MAKKPHCPICDEPVQIERSSQRTKIHIKEGETEVCLGSGQVAVMKEPDEKKACKACGQVVLYKHGKPVPHPPRDGTDTDCDGEPPENASGASEAASRTNELVTAS